jgi:hypothetical protein
MTANGQVLPMAGQLKTSAGTKDGKQTKNQCMNLQFKINRSAGTAAEKRSKCSVLSGRPLLLAILMLCAVSCNEIKKEKEEQFYKEQHDKYRTLMYRSNFEKCFVDSCRKYGLLYNEAIGLKESDINSVDTIPFNGIGVCQ